jgi:hypothetical protein
MNTLRANRVLTTRATRRSELSAEERRELRGLLEIYFDGVTEAQFESDLAEKDWVLRLWLNGRLAGFSTVATGECMAAGVKINVVYSGDTIIAPEAWGTTELAKGWIGLVREVLASMPARPAYWLLLSSGFRTYRFLPVFWREFWPRFDAAMPAKKKELRDELAGARFGAAYDTKTGLVRFSRPQRLRGSLAEVPQGRERDAHIAFFLKANPGHTHGDELVCLTELSDENLTAAGRRIVREAIQ